MARTVDPARHEARRLAIIDAALTCFARDGYDRATTAAICREVGIGSGTFFHYFPTKLEVLLAMLELGTREESHWFAAQAGRDDARAVLEDYVAHTAEEMADVRVAGLVRAVGAVMTQPEVAAALEHDTAAIRAGLLPWVRAAVAAGEVRTDLPPERLVLWLQALLDGYLGVVVTEPGFDAAAESATLLDAVRRLLRP
ncbi:TetR/AcrR family transcriptional regulator [Nocardioides houyundeii]|uniref:TetR/AcrR family transcriptional regulator n=1 Tax=Nocardioides houyundeii TaxID=2045452 RepID=UPI000DF11BAF|nr:TetR/AcrR family transcriptional regulator [Nocardioides houyundeii]